MPERRTKYVISFVLLLCALVGLMFVFGQVMADEEKTEAEENPLIVVVPAEYSYTENTEDIEDIENTGEASEETAVVEVTTEPVPEEAETPEPTPDETPVSDETPIPEETPEPETEEESETPPESIPEQVSEEQIPSDEITE